MIQHFVDIFYHVNYLLTTSSALASSAPIWQFTGLTPCNGFYDVASNTWLSASKICVENVHVSYQALDDLAGQGVTVFS